MPCAAGGSLGRGGGGWWPRLRRRRRHEKWGFRTRPLSLHHSHLQHRRAPGRRRRRRRGRERSASSVALGWAPGWTPGWPRCCRTSAAGGERQGVGGACPPPRNGFRAPARPAPVPAATDTLLPMGDAPGAYADSPVHHPATRRPHPRQPRVANGRRRRPGRGEWARGGVRQPAWPPSTASPAPPGILSLPVRSTSHCTASHGRSVLPRRRCPTSAAPLTQVTSRWGGSGVREGGRTRGRG